MPRSLRLTPILLVGGLALSCSSDDSTEPITPPPPLPATPFVVSNPVAGPGGGSVAYLSLPPGTFAEGGAVTLHAPRASSDTAVDLVGGGFDPAPVPAAVGDTLTATVQAGPTAAGQVFRMLVPAAAAPRVVRTDPGDHRLGVPLDAIITVVFSEPVDLASLAGRLTLTRGGVPVPGHVVAEGPAHPEWARFSAMDSLAPSSTFVLAVASGARDLGGDSMAAAFRSDFTTDTAPTPPPPPPVASILVPKALDTVLADFARFEVVAGSTSGLDHVEFATIGAAGDTVPNIRIDFAGDFVEADSLRLRVNFWFSAPAGWTSLIATSEDTLGVRGSSSPVPVLLASPDTTARIVIRDFYVLELRRPDGFVYVPQLRVSDSPGQGGVQILGFQLLNFTNFPYEWPRMYGNGIDVGADSSVSLFGVDAYGQHEVMHMARDLRRLGPEATARLAYRDSSGRIFTWTFSGPTDSTLHWVPTNAVCGRWGLQMAWVVGGDLPPCYATVRLVGSEEASETRSTDGSATVGQLEVHHVKRPDF